MQSRLDLGWPEKEERSGVDPRNKLNDLTGKEWVAFTKSWSVHNPPPRRGAERLHPAKFPETMIMEFIEFFTKRNEEHVVFDPFLGTGSTLVAVDICNERYGGNRRGIGIELLPKYAEVAESRSSGTVICADSVTHDFSPIEPVHFVITSPPYWDVLHKDTGKLKERRESEGLDSRYSDDPADLGNVHDYEGFQEKLVEVSRKIYDILVPGRFFVVILSDTNKREKYVRICADFGRKLEEETPFILKGVKMWCQDNKRLLPYGYPYSFVPNFMHHECLIFRKERRSEHFV